MARNMCDKSLLNDILEQVSDYSKTVFGDKLKSVTLYGSYARGDYDDESDIDLMIMVNLPISEIWSRRKEINHFCAELNLKHGIFISPILQSTDHFNKWKDTVAFYRNVINDGVSIYG